jgi:hypothetical protein
VANGFVLLILLLSFRVAFEYGEAFWDAVQQCCEAFLRTFARLLCDEEFAPITEDEVRWHLCTVNAHQSHEEASL